MEVENMKLNDSSRRFSMITLSLKELQHSSKLINWIGVFLIIYAVFLGVLIGWNCATDTSLQSKHLLFLLPTSSMKFQILTVNCIQLGLILIEGILCVYSAVQISTGYYGACFICYVSSLGMLIGYFLLQIVYIGFQLWEDQTCENEDLFCTIVYSIICLILIYPFYSLIYSENLTKICLSFIRTEGLVMIAIVIIWGTKFMLEATLSSSDKVINILEMAFIIILGFIGLNSLFSSGLFVVLEGVIGLWIECILYLVFFFLRSEFSKTSTLLTGLEIVAALVVTFLIGFGGVPYYVYFCSSKSVLWMDGLLVREDVDKALKENKKEESMTIVIQN